MGCEVKAKSEDQARDDLLNAAAAWVESRGGSVVVVGGIRIITWPEEGEFKFTVGVRCTGRKPQSEDGNANS